MLMMRRMKRRRRGVASSCPPTSPSCPPSQSSWRRSSSCRRRGPRRSRVQNILCNFFRYFLNNRMQTAKNVCHIHLNNIRKLNILCSYLNHKNTCLIGIAEFRNSCHTAGLSRVQNFLCTNSIYLDSCSV